MRSFSRLSRNKFTSIPTLSLATLRRPAVRIVTPNLLTPTKQSSPMSSSTSPAVPEGLTASTSAEQTTPATSQPELPPLSPQMYRIYNRLAESMDYFHEHFRQTWNLLYTAASTGKRPAGMTLKQFLDEGLSLVRYLETHHNIEEIHIFPILARKMAEFRSTGGKAELLRQHQAIHKGMDGFEEYLKKVKGREVDLEMSVLKEKMDSWGPVLLKHLDQEVATLGAENMRKYWTVDEMRAIPI